jgi:hypothetical protein
MNIEKLLLAILLSLLVLLGISITCLLIVACVTYFISIGQCSGLIGIISVLILFVFLVSYFYKNIEE